MRSQKTFYEFIKYAISQSSTPGYGCGETDVNKGKLYVVGTGPGGLDHITPAARAAVAESSVIIGYRTYLDLIADLTEGKEVVSSEMMKEVDRTRQALDRAAAGAIVSLVSGGDPGVYAMAGLTFEIARENQSVPVIEIVPGIAALNGCAARLGAPLMHDFASISLSDHLTPWEVIETRLHHAAEADFVIVLYNPKSRRRAKHIAKSRDIIMKYRSSDTPVGIVTAATRENEAVILTTLENMLETDVGMQTTVIIGNRSTFSWNGYMVTPRGYKNKYSFI